MSRVDHPDDVCDQTSLREGPTMSDRPAMRPRWRSGTWSAAGASGCLPVSRWRAPCAQGLRQLRAWSL